MLGFPFLKLFSAYVLGIFVKRRKGNLFVVERYAEQFKTLRKLTRWDSADFQEIT